MTPFFLLLQHFQQYVQQFQEKITVIKKYESLEVFEMAADQIHEAFQSYKEFYHFAHQLVKCKWLPALLRPGQTQWETTFATLQQVYEYFQQTRLRRLDAKY